MRANFPPWDDEESRPTTVIDYNTGQSIPLRDAEWDERAQAYRRTDHGDTVRHRAAAVREE